MLHSDGNKKIYEYQDITPRQTVCYDSTGSCWYRIGRWIDVGEGVRGLSIVECMMNWWKCGWAIVISGWLNARKTAIAEMTQKGTQWGNAKGPPMYTYGCDLLLDIFLCLMKSVDEVSLNIPSPSWSLEIFQMFTLCCSVYVGVADE